MVVVAGNSTREESSADGPFLTAGLADQVAASAIGLSRAALPERPERGVPCIRLGMRPAAHPRARVPALASAPEWVDGPALARVPAERPGSFRLRAKRRVRNAPAPMHGVDASNIPRQKKAR